jgi:hypothetical protein
MHGLKWAHANVTKTIFMKPLDIRRGRDIMNLVTYARDVRRHVKAIFRNPETTDKRENVSPSISQSRYWVGGPCTTLQEISAHPATWSASRNNNKLRNGT